MARLDRGMSRSSPFLVSSSWAVHLVKSTSFQSNFCISPRRIPVSRANRMIAFNDGVHSPNSFFSSIGDNRRSRALPGDGFRTDNTGLRNPSIRHSFMATVYRLEMMASSRRTELSERPAFNRRSRYSARSAPRIRDKCSLAILSVLRLPIRYSSILPDFFRLETSLP